MEKDFTSLKGISEKFEDLHKEHETLIVELEELRPLKKRQEEMLEEILGLNNTILELSKKCENFMRCTQLVEAEKAILESNYNLLQTQSEQQQERIQKLEEEAESLKKLLSTSEEERRFLHNAVQDLKGNIRVFCRVRPSKHSEGDRMPCLLNFSDETTFDIRRSRESVSITGKPTDLKVQFTFDRIFPPDSTQSEVFEDLAQLVQSALDGFHICVLAYGQTGSGKTFTMLGDSPKERQGMIPRTVELLFKKKENLETMGWKYLIRCSFLEIYNDTIKDLLNPGGKAPLEIRFNEGRGTTVTNLLEKDIESPYEFYKLMQKAQESRATASTNFNEHSSRSHAVTKISIEGRKRDHKSVFLGSLHLVDLAGSESAKTTQNERLAETKNINKSLATLGDVMFALYNKDNHVPYRNSKLTYLLQSCLGGNSKTLMIVNISPFEDCFNETMNSLRFAAKVKEVKTTSRRNKIVNY